MSTSTALKPCLPYDLERVIFDLAAIRRPRSIPMLMLVAWRVKEWLQPLLFRVLNIQSKHRASHGHERLASCTFATFERLARTFRPLMQQSLRNASLSELSHEQQRVIFTLAPNIENLHIAVTSLTADIAPQVRLHHLTRLSQLSAGFWDLAIHLELDARALTPTHVCFARLTHVHLFIDRLITSPSLWPNVAALPALTHLASAVWLPRLQIQRILDSALLLRVFVLPIGFPNPEHAEIAETSTAQDPRVVLLMTYRTFESDWGDAVRGAESLWERADRFVRERAEAQDPTSMKFMDVRDATSPN